MEDEVGGGVVIDGGEFREGLPFPGQRGQIRLFGAGVVIDVAVGGDGELFLTLLTFAQLDGDVGLLAEAPVKAALAIEVAGGVGGDAKGEVFGVDVRVRSHPVSFNEGAADVAVVGVLLIVLPGVVAEDDIGLVLADKEDELLAQFVERDGVHEVVAPVEADNLVDAEVTEAGAGFAEVDDVVVGVAVVAVLFVVGGADVDAAVAIFDEARDEAAHAVVGGVVVVVRLGDEYDLAAGQLAEGQGLSGGDHGQRKKEKPFAHRSFGSIQETGYAFVDPSTCHAAHGGDPYDCRRELLPYIFGGASGAAAGPAWGYDCDEDGGFGRVRLSEYPADEDARQSVDGTVLC